MPEPYPISDCVYGVVELVHGLWVHLDVPLASFVRYDLYLQSMP